MSKKSEESVGRGLVDERRAIECGEWLKQWFGSYGFRDEGSARNFLCAFISAAVGDEMRGVRPMFVFRASKPGVGKSVLAKACIQPTYGEVATYSLSSAGDLPKMIESCLLGRKVGKGGCYCFWDNVLGSYSDDLCYFLDADKVVIRKLCSQVKELVLNEVSIFATSNGAGMSEDVLRRVKVIDLEEVDYVGGLRSDILEEEEWSRKALEVIYEMIAGVGSSREGESVWVFIDRVIQHFLRRCNVESCFSLLGKKGVEGRCVDAVRDGLG